MRFGILETGDRGARSTWICWIHVRENACGGFGVGFPVGNGGVDLAEDRFRLGRFEVGGAGGGQQVVG